uniref:Uncharacterized protein n=1 Tax=Triticum urartu TaxID=4572 RepID=A0A8R7QJD5_TRIUA
HGWISIIDKGPSFSWVDLVIVAESSIGKDSLPLALVPFNPVGAQREHVLHGFHLAEQRPSYHVYDYHLPSSTPHGDGFLATLKYLDAVVMAPVMQ